MLALGFSDNVQYSYDPHAEQGKRINHITINGEPVDPAKHYRVAGNTFLLNEGDDFTGFGTKTGSNKTEDSGIMDVDAFNAYLNSVKDLKPRGNQTSVGVHIDGAQDGKLVPGSTIKVKLSSLSYTAGEQKANNVTVSLGDQTQTAKVDNTVTKNHNETGQAEVSLTVPQNATTLKIDADNGTTMELPIAGGEAEQPTQPGSTNPFLEMLKRFFSGVSAFIGNIITWAQRLVGSSN